MEEIEQKEIQQFNFSHIALETQEALWFFRYLEQHRVFGVKFGGYWGYWGYWRVPSPVYTNLTPELLRKHLINLWTEKKLGGISSSPEDWIPSWANWIVRWVIGSIMFNADFDNLGVELIKQNRLDLVSVLADCGDLKAKPKAIRSKLPKELIGKELQYEKLSETEWRVTILPQKRSICEYEKLYEQNKELWEVKEW